MRVKMDYNTWTKHVVEIVNRSKSEYCKDYGFSVVMGIDIMSSYLKEICERAIKTDDPIILSNLLNLGVIKPDNEQEKKEIHERAKSLREEQV